MCNCVVDERTTRIPFEQAQVFVALTGLPFLLLQDQRARDSEMLFDVSSLIHRIQKSRTATLNTRRDFPKAQSHTVSIYLG